MLSTISSSATLFFFCLQSFPESGSFPKSWLFTSGRQKYWSLNVSPSNEYLGLTGCSSCKTHEFSPALQLESISSLVLNLLYVPQPSDLGRGTAHLLVSYPFVFLILPMGFSRQEYWSALPFSSPVDYVLSEHFTMTRLSQVALHSMAHGFIELFKHLCHNKVVIHASSASLVYLYAILVN